MLNTNGLSKEEVIKSRKKYGTNTLTSKKKKSFLMQFVETLGDPIIKILLTALIIKTIFLFKDFDWYSGKNRTYHEYFPIFLIYHFCRCGCTVTCIGLQFLPRQLRCMA